MRKMIALAAVLAVHSAHAAEELKFGDLNYFFKGGQVNALANFNSVYQKEKVVSDMFETRGYVIETQLTYGVSDQLNVFLGLDYAYDLQTETSGNPDFNSDGLANPSLGAIYRLMNQSSTSYNIDLGAVARVGIEDAENGSATGPGVSDDGNFADGRNSLEVLARIGRKWNESNEWQLAVGVEYFMDGESTTVGSPDVDQDDNSSMDMYLRASYQYRPVNEIMFLLSAQATQVGEAVSETTSGPKVKTTLDSHMDMDLRFTTKYLVTDNTIVKFNYGMSRNADFDIKSGPVSDEVSKRRENFFGLGVDFLF